MPNVNVDKVGASIVQAVSSVDFTIGAEATNVINVAMQFKDADGNNLEEAVCVGWYLSSNATGQGIATAHTSAPAIGTDGLLITELASLSGKLVTEADGDADIDFTDTGAKTVYLNIVMPNGEIHTSGAITHA